MRAPLCSRASTTTVATQSPATMRLRAGKRHGAGATPGGYSETTSPPLGYLARELGVRARIVAVDAAAEHGDGRPLRFERTSMRPAVDAAREAGDDDDSGGGELTRERARDMGAVVAAAARSDDRDARPGEQLARRRAAEEETRRWVADRRQTLRERLVASPDPANPLPCELGEVGGSVERRGEAREALRSASRSTACSSRDAAKTASARSFTARGHRFDAIDVVHARSAPSASGRTAPRPRAPG